MDVVHLLVPIMPWMRAANDGLLGTVLLLSAPTLFWTAASLVLYARLRRLNP